MSGQTLYLTDSRGLRRLYDIAAASSGSVFIWQVQESYIIKVRRGHYLVLE